MADEQKALKAGHIDLGFAKLPVAVLKDGTRVITTSGFSRALGFTTTGGHRKKKDQVAQLPYFLRINAVKALADNELIASIQPIPFKMVSGGNAIGYKASILPKICELFLKARDIGALTEKQLEYAASADLIMRSLAHIGIIALVDEATGYQEFRDKTALQAILDKYLSAEAAKWAKTFPDSFYLGIFKLKNWNPDKVIRGKPGVVAHYTKDLVYNRLAPGLLESLQEKNPITDSGRRRNCHHQFLTQEQGLSHLKGHLFMVQKIMKMSKNWDDFMEKINSLLPYATTEDIELNDNEVDISYRKDADVQQMS